MRPEVRVLVYMQNISRQVTNGGVLNVGHIWFTCRVYTEAWRAHRGAFRRVLCDLTRFGPFDSTSDAGVENFCCSTRHVNQHVVMHFPTWSQKRPEKKQTMEDRLNVTVCFCPIVCDKLKWGRLETKDKMPSAIALVMVSSLARQLMTINVNTHLHLLHHITSHTFWKNQY